MKNIKNYNEAMTLPELVLAIFMLIAFTGFTVMIVSYTSRFFQPLNVEVKEEDISSGKELGDMLNDHTQINNAFDSIIEILSEPGIKKESLLNLECEYGQEIPGKWNIPSINTKAIPESYRICIKPSSLTESSYSDLLSGEGKPGIYILYSQPDGGVSVNATPVRRIFCRPKPFCKL